MAEPLCGVIPVYRELNAAGSICRSAGSEPGQSEKQAQISPATGGVTCKHFVSGAGSTVMGQRQLRDGGESGTWDLCSSE